MLWVKQCHKPPMTGTIYGDLGDGLSLFYRFTHYIIHIYIYRLLLSVYHLYIIE